jgi:transporter family protein
MWVLLAFASAMFAGITAILSKIGMQKINSNLGTALRTIVVLIFTWLMVIIVKGYESFAIMKPINYVYIILSGACTGFSWLAYFRALQLGNINKVTPVDKSSTILTIVLSIIILNEAITLKIILGIILIGFGTYLMITKKETIAKKEKRTWLIYAILSAVFASLTSILAKMGMEGINSQLATALRTIVVLIMSWIIVFASNRHKEIKAIDKRAWLFIILSGVATGISWLCYFQAVKDGINSIVTPIDKLSIVFTVAFSYFFFKEKLTKKSFIGLILIIIGTLALLFVPEVFNLQLR